MAEQIEAEMEIEDTFSSKDCRTRTDQHIGVVVRWNQDGPPKKVGEIACWVDIVFDRPHGDVARIYVQTEKDVGVSERFVKDLMRTYAVREATVLVVPYKNVVRLGTLTVR